MTAKPTRKFITADEFIAELPPERRVRIDARSKQLIAEEHARPARRDRRVFATTQLTDEEIAAFEGAKMHPRHDHLNAELNDESE